MNEYSDSFEFLQEYSPEFKERQALSRISNAIVECRWKVSGVTAEWREITGGYAGPWFSVSAVKPRKPALRRGRRVQVLLDDDAYEKARRLGKGNVGEGIRAALADVDCTDGLQTADDPGTSLMKRNDTA